MSTPAAVGRAETGLPADAGVVGFPTALATAVGLIMASPVILTVTSGFGMGGGAFVVAIAIAFVVMQAQATSFAEAAALLPTKGSVYDYISCGLGRFLRDHRNGFRVSAGARVRRHRRDDPERRHGAGELRVAEYRARAQRHLLARGGGARRPVLHHQCFRDPRLRPRGDRAHPRHVAHSHAVRHCGAAAMHLLWMCKAGSVHRRWARA